MGSRMTDGVEDDGWGRRRWPIRSAMTVDQVGHDGVEDDG